MKNISKFRSTIIIAVLFIFGLNFVGCEKEKEIIENKQAQKTLNEMSEYELDTYIADIANTTGVDLHKVCEQQCLNDLSLNNAKKIKHCVNNIGAKGVITEEKLSVLQGLLQLIQTAYHEDRLVDAMEYYNEFCAVCSTIDGFVINSNDYELQTITFNESLIPVSIPFNYLNDERLHAENFFFELESSVPELWNLAEETRTDIVALALYLRSKSNNKYFSYEDCELEARRMLALSLSVATALYQAALITCAATGPVSIGCLAVASASYGVAVGVSYFQYERAVKKCREQ